MNRRRFLLLAGAAAASGQEGFEQNLIQAPAGPAEWPGWRDALARWRAAARTRLGYSGALYRRPDFAWVPSCFSCCFVMLCDETFYDHARARYTVDAFLDHGVKEFGGYDSLVLWHAYPRIGLDDRNQFDFYRDMPGGLEGLREVSRACHRRGVKVFVDYNPWDRGTRREQVDDIDALVALVAAVEADGIFLDTMNRGAAAFRAKLDAARKGVVLESELALPLANLHDHHMSWAQWFRDSRAPGVLRNKWLERRHMLHQIDRFSRDHSAELHTAWMNGTGMMVWENVFGTWVGWNARDRSLYRLMLPVQRRFALLFSGEGWTPLVEAETEGVYASQWEGGGMRLWTLVNRNDRAVEGDLLRVEERSGDEYYDLFRGERLRSGGLLPGRMEARGAGAIAAGPREAFGSGFQEFLSRQARAWREYRGDTTFPARTAALKPAGRTRLYREAPPGMAAIPSARVRLKVEFRIREPGFYEPQHSHFEGSGGHPLHRPIFFERAADLSRYAIDLTPVTNAQYARFLKASGYRLRFAQNFLKHWQGGAPPAGMGDHPVVYVDLEDARAYARWAGKRLPTEEEWQYAAQGPEALRYPWGNEMKPGVCNAGETGGTTPVTAFPGGRSPFGCYDMCGNTWEWTESERADGRTRFSILRGGSWYRASGSDWYMDGGPRPAGFAAKFLLMWPGLDRCATAGFRCAADLEEKGDRGT
ncbi:MAG: SUMF1/EgtB/PvdO family nonheme iron enzyme [Bryobacterales bacterium]|nr:SUMF1/EgtB/PvdO family nonheme iron enzyme [Bryobacterales bacterium]